MRVTLKQIANRTNLSVVTVSHVLGGRSGFSDATKKKVTDAAAKLGYRPMGSARAMRSGSIGAVAVVVGRDVERSQLLPGVQAGIHDALAERGMNLMLARLSDDDLESEDKVPRLLRELTVDGLIINYTHATPTRLIQLIERYQIPCIWLNKKVSHDCVYPDDFSAAGVAARYLIDAGHQRILFLDASHSPELMRTSHYSVQDRYEGYAQAMRQAGLKPERMLGKGTERPAVLDLSAYSWTTGPDRPTAILAYQEVDASSALYAAACAGLAVPSALSIMTFAYSALLSFGFPVTYMAVPGVELGRTAVEQLCKKIAAPARKLQPVAVQISLVAGGSVAARKADDRRKPLKS